MHYKQKCELTYETKREVRNAMRKAQKAVDIECDHYKDRYRFVELPQSDNHFADVGKKDGMSLSLALIVIDRLNTTERIDVARDNLAEAVRVVSAAAKKQVPQKPKPDLFYYGYGKCPTCGAVFEDRSTNYCGNCGQALDWS
jgi:rubrerythrin